jgi:hypothetical protein
VRPVGIPCRGSSDGSGFLRARERGGGRVWGSPGLQGRAGVSAGCLPRATVTPPKRPARWGKACPIDVVARWPSPPPSAALAARSRRRAGPRGSVDRAARSPVKMCARAPRDLGAVFPDGDPVRAARHRCRASSPGVVQRTPLHRTVEESTPGMASLPRLRDAATSRTLVPPTWFLTTSTGSSSSTSRACCIPLPILGFTAFPPRPKTGLPAMPSCPPKPCSPPAATSPRAPREVALAWVVEPLGSRHRPRSFEPVRSPRALALLAFLPPAASTVARRACPESRASRALLRRRVRTPATG